MADNLSTSLNTLLERYEELHSLLSEPSVIADQKQFLRYSKEYAEIEPVVQCYQTYLAVEQTLDEAKALLKDSDAAIRVLAQEEREAAEQQKTQLEAQLTSLLLTRDSNDARNIFLEVRAGTGGDEAAIFAGDLFRMYARYAETKNWQLELISEKLGEHGGYKEIIARLSGKDVYAHLKFESGAHRVQRVPKTESQGRVHTSACTVAIMPEVAIIDEVAINKADLRIDTFRASGAGGQHVNKTDSAIRITHLPTGVVVECQDERSQHKNKARAMALLQAKLLDQVHTEQQQETADERRNLVGSGDRSERIRTYNYPQGRVTDHRIQLTLYQLPAIMEGALGEMIDALRNAYQADQLAATQHA